VHHNLIVTTLCASLLSLCPSPLSLHSPCRHCHMRLIIIAACTLSLLPCSPCHCCHVRLVIVAMFALSSLSPHVPCHCCHMRLIVFIMCASSSSPHLPCCCCSGHLIIVAAFIEHAIWLIQYVVVWGAASASTAHLARISLTSTAGSIMVAWTTQMPRVSRVRVRVAMSADSPLVFFTLQVCGDASMSCTVCWTR
jgi:hypothetical protein